jgi:hypothetical protein
MKRTITGSDATRMPGPLGKIAAKRRRINPPPPKTPRVVKGRGWVA